MLKAELTPLDIEEIAHKPVTSALFHGDTREFDNLSIGEPEFLALDLEPHIEDVQDNLAQPATFPYLCD